MAKKKTEIVDPSTIDEVKETILINGMPFEEAAVLAMPDGANIWAQGLAAKAALLGRDVVRNKIKNEVADTQSILGTTADGAQLAVTMALIDIVALDAEDSFAAYKATKTAILEQVFGTDPTTGGTIDLPVFAQSVLDKIASQEVMLTGVVKGVPGVLDEVMDRSTKVVAILAGASAK